MKPHIVITSIFSPTEAIEKFSKLSEYNLIVVGDKKSPIDWGCTNSTFLSVEDQAKMDLKLATLLPYNHYCRKMMGYLYAIKNGATTIIDTDDDNIPKENWVFPAFEETFEVTPNNLGFINIYNHFTDQKIWPRGLPLRLINQPREDTSTRFKKVKVGVWQGLADEDPDVDALYRLTSDKTCCFSNREPIVLGKGTISPFNTQNTAIVKELFALMYLPCHVTFRFTDILRGLVAQPIMWAADYNLGFINATVVQKRNPHDYFKDFVSEIPMYLNIDKVIELGEKVVKSKNSVEDNLYNSYIELEKNSIVNSDEIKIIEAWLQDLHSNK